ncbi:MAG TPA: YlxR family protein [Actinomycetota bacterium]|nr:YlxR family protein [Actinomycetota bacterium]
MGAEPVRTCVGCRTRRPRAELVRVVRAPDGAVALERSRGAPGRGAYLCADGRRCLEEALRSGRLARALRREGALPGGLVEALARRVAGEAGRAGRSDG